MGKTHEDSIKELNDKIPYTVGPVHDTITRFKKPLVIVLNLMSRIPAPTIEICKKKNSNPNAILLIEAREDFFNHLNLPTRDKPLLAIINFVIMMVAYDMAYTPFFNWWVRRLTDLVNQGKWNFEGHKRWWNDAGSK